MRAAIHVALALGVTACDYPRPPALEGEPIDAAAVDAADPDGAPIDAPDVDAAIDAAVDEIDASVDAAGAAIVALDVSPESASTTLGTTTRYTIRLSSTNLSGDVRLDVTSAPTGWTTRIMPTMVTLGADGAAVATLDVTVPSNGPASPSGAGVTVRAQTPLGARIRSVSHAVADQYVVPIAGNTGAGAHWGTLAGETVSLRVGTALVFENDDATPHRIHTGGGVPGFVHQAVSFPFGASYTITSTAAGTDEIYCHDHGQGTGKIIVTVQ